MRSGLTVAYLGNHSVDFSTESHVAASFESLGYTVARLQEGDVPALEIPQVVFNANADLFLHTQTYGLAVSGGSVEERIQMVRDIESAGIPTARFHLDLWHGLARAEHLKTEAYFLAPYDWLFSTDGGHDEEWKQLGIRHHYLPPGVYHAEAFDAQPNVEFVSDVAFVGSVHYGHPEHAPTRSRMIRQLQRRYGRNFRTWPQGPAVRGIRLTELYASVKVVAGDSCLAGQIPGYFSDRVFETVGRGGFLVHPYVEGLLDCIPDLVTYPAGDWAAMLHQIDYFLQHDDERESIRQRCSAHVREHHTYRNRVQTLLEVIGLV